MAKLIQKIIGNSTGRYSLLLILGLLVESAAYPLLAEKTGWVYFILGILALIPLALFLNNRAVVHLFGLLCVAILMAGVYVADDLQETDREQALRKTREILRAVETADLATLERHLSDKFTWQGMNRKQLLDRARRVLNTSASRSCSISSAQVQGLSGDERLVVSGNLTATGQFGSEEAFFTGVIYLTYARQPDGQYKLIGTKVQFPGGQEVVLPAR
jgi:hypothetical protein